jgi:hypothetical protein
LSGEYDEPHLEIVARESHRLALREVRDALWEILDQPGQTIPLEAVALSLFGKGGRFECE